MNINYYDLYYTGIKNRDNKEVIVDKFGNNKNDYITFTDNVTANHYVGRKINIEFLRKRNLSSYINHFN